MFGFSKSYFDDQKPSSDYKITIQYDEPVHDYTDGVVD